MNFSNRCRESIRAAGALLAVMISASCALPPGTAWTVIRKDGFRDYLAISWGKKPVPEYVKELVPEAFGLPAEEVTFAENEPAKEGEAQVVADGGVFPEAPEMTVEDWMRPIEPVFPLMPTEPPNQKMASNSPVGVQTTGVNPLLGIGVDNEFAQVTIPEPPTMPKPDVVPEVVEKAKVNPGAAPGFKLKGPARADSVDEVTDRLTKGLSETAKSMNESGSVLKQGQEVTEGSSKPKVTANELEKGKMGTGSEKMADKAVSDEVPFGIRVDGRPGFVRSPFTQTHQIVDVTGFEVGASVKCPFSGKFFRVPAVQAATNNKAKEEALPNVDSDNASGEEPS
jgi:hypothetical protein